jgi:hypothetical protein
MASFLRFSGYIKKVRFEHVDNISSLSAMEKNDAWVVCGKCAHTSIHEHMCNTNLGICMCLTCSGRVDVKDVFPAVIHSSRLPASLTEGQY